MTYNYYVAYHYENGDGAIFMKTNVRYTTRAYFESLIDYISVNFCGGKLVIITNLIELESEEDDENTVD